jgi:hypothetical protein
MDEAARDQAVREREAQLGERRRRVLRAEALVAASFGLGLAGVAAAKELAPGAFEEATAGFVLALAGSLLLVARTARRHWRCPACDVRWETSDTLASFHWHHCPACGVALTQARLPRPRERAASLDFELSRAAGADLRSTVERRRRRSRWVAGGCLALGLASLVWLDSVGAPEWIHRAAIAAAGGTSLALLVHGARCPRCGTGALVRGVYCSRCGLSLDADLGAPQGPERRAARRPARGVSPRA